MAGVLGDTTCRCGKTARRAATLGRGLAVIGISGGRSAEPRQMTNACDTLAQYLEMSNDCLATSRLRPCPICRRGRRSSGRQPALSRRY